MLGPAVTSRPKIDPQQVCRRSPFAPKCWRLSKVVSQRSCFTALQCVLVSHALSLLQLKSSVLFICLCVCFASRLFELVHVRIGFVFGLLLTRRTADAVFVCQNVYVAFHFPSVAAHSSRVSRCSECPACERCAVCFDRRCWHFSSFRFAAFRRQIPRPIVDSERITYYTCTPPRVMSPPAPSSNYIAVDEVSVDYHSRFSMCIRNTFKFFCGVVLGFSREV